MIADAAARKRSSITSARPVIRHSRYASSSGKQSESISYLRSHTHGDISVSSVV